jgi:type IV pilus assembly protein PilP
MKKIFALGMALFGLAIAGCGDEPRPASAPRTPPVAKPKEPAKDAAAPSAASAVPPLRYAYNPLGKRDPFRSPAEDLQRKAQANAICTEPLCQWGLEQLVLVAVVTGDSSPVAMVQDPQGRGHIVRRNTRMGKQGGRVTQILRDSLTVTEQFTGPDGKVNNSPVSIRIREDKRSSQPAFDFMNGRQIE